MSSIDDTNFGMLLLLSMLLRNKQALRLGLETHLFKLDTTDIIQYENAINYIIVFIPSFFKWFDMGISTKNSELI